MSFFLKNFVKKGSYNGRQNQNYFRMIFSNFKMHQKEDSSAVDFKGASFFFILLSINNWTDEKQIKREENKPLV